MPKLVCNLQQDTRGYASNSAIMQIYRDKQAFIVICDISDEESLNSVPEWIHQIKECANVSDYIIMVLANKCELDIDQSVVLNLETRLEKQGIPYHEISVNLNLMIQTALTQLADLLNERRENFIQQRLQTIISRQSRSSFMIAESGVAKLSNQMLRSPSLHSKNMPAYVTIGDKKVFLGEMIGDPNSIPD